MKDFYSFLSGTTAQSFRISNAGPTISSGEIDPNTPPAVTGRAGDLYVLLGFLPRAFMLGGDGIWRALSTEQMFVRRKITTSTDSPTDDDYYLGVAGTGNVTITLPPGTPDKRFVIKDESGNPDREITVAASSGETIDGAASFRIVQPHASINLVYGDEWHVF